MYTMFEANVPDVLFLKLNWHPGVSYFKKDTTSQMIYSEPDVSF